MNIEEKINYNFKNKDILLEALTHSSYGNESSKKDNERLEFLGDSIISFLVTKHLFVIFPQYNEGELSKLKNQIVSTKSFYKIIKKNRLEKYLLLGKGEKKSGGKKRESNLAGLFESLVGGIYKDSGIKSAESFLKRFLSKLTLLRMFLLNSNIMRIDYSYNNRKISYLLLFIPTI